MAQNRFFVHLHVHTEYSLLDGAIRIPKMLEKAWSLGMDSVAITDHGNMFGAVQFFDQARKSGIKPILGCEVYLAPGDRRDRSTASNGGPSSYHLILLVMDDTGYKNLSRLVTLGHLEGFYYHPRIDMELLRELNSGLIALSACLKGPVAFPIREGKMDVARARAIELASIFDKDRFFVEVQANGMRDQEKVNEALKELAQELSLPMVATNDCHYLERKDSEAHDALLCIQTGKTVDDANRLRFPTDEFYFKSREEMEKGLPGFEEALDNTQLVANRCNFDMEFGNYKYPVFDVPGGKSLDEMLREQAEKGLLARLKEREELEGPTPEDISQQYRERLEYELGIICKMGFSGYFLIVSDFIEYARRSNIPVGPGRGSAAGSLVAYCLRITNIDPIKYGLLFERFLNPQRISMPDIDIDFCMNGRDDVIRYVAEKYGKENVSQIITFGTMKARAVIRDVGRTLNIPLAEVDRIAKMVPEGPKVSLEKAIASEPDLQALEKEKPYVAKLLSISKALEGLARHASTHASGVVISDRPLVEYLPLYKGPRNEIMTQFTMDRIEQLGLIKFDFLGLRTLTVIKHTIDLIERTLGHKLDIERIPLTDEATYQLCCEGKTTGVFQLESDGMKDLMRRLKPGVFEDMVALVALYRPGPLGSNMIDEFIQGKHGKVKINFTLPQLEPILKETYGVILYQEQVMRIAQVLANYSLAEADELRKAIGKKKPEVMAKHRERFIEGSVNNGVSRETAERLFELIEKFGGYGFNKSHSVAYAMIAYQTAYLKAHYPVQFMTALLTQDMGNQDKTIKNIAECREMGIEILPPDINESEADFSVVEGKIRFGLGAIKNVGLKAVESIIEQRKANGPFRSIHDFCRRVEGAKVNKRVLEGLIQCGAFDFTGIPRARLLAGIDDISRFCGTSHDPNQLSMFGFTAGESEGAIPLFELPDVEEWGFKEKLRREKESLGFYITGHPLDRFRDDLARLVTCSIQDLSHQQDRSTVQVVGVVESMKVKRTKKGDKMAVISLEDLSGSIEVIIFPDLFSSTSSLLKSDDPLLVTGGLEKTETSMKIIAKELTTLDAAREKFLRALELPLGEEAINDELLDDIKALAFTYPGECQLRFRVCSSNGQSYLIAAHNRYRVIPAPELISKLESLIGTSVRKLTS